MLHRLDRKITAGNIYTQLAHYDNGLFNLSQTLSLNFHLLKTTDPLEV
jgi:hypothetical protein